MNESTKTIGSLIRITREKSGLTQQELGEKWGITRQTIAAYERGEIPDGKNPPIEFFLSDQFDLMFAIIEKLSNERDHIKLKLTAAKNDIAKVLLNL